MSKIFTPIRNSLMNMGDYFSPLDPPWRSLFFGAQSTRGAFQVALVASKESRVGNHLSRTQGSKLFQSNVNPNRSY